MMSTSYVLHMICVTASGPTDKWETTHSKTSPHNGACQNQGTYICALYMLAFHNPCIPTLRCNIQTSHFSMLLPLTNILDWINNLNGKVAPTLTVTLKLLKQCRTVSFGFQSDHECPCEMPIFQYLDCALTLYASAHTKNGTNFQNFWSLCQSSSSAVLG